MDDGGGQKLWLSKFDPRKMLPDSVSLLLGKRRTGKSVLQQDLVYHMRHTISDILVISETDGSSNSWRRHVHKRFVKDYFSSPHLAAVYREQKTRWAAYKRRLRHAKRNGLKTKEKTPILAIVIDDMASDPTLHRDAAITKVYTNGRHHGIMLVHALQYSKTMLPVRRGNADYVFVFRESSLVRKRMIYEEWFGMFPTFEIFNTVMTKFTEDRGCLVLDDASDKTDIESCVFWYKAVPDRRFRISNE